MPHHIVLTDQQSKAIAEAMPIVGDIAYPHLTGAHQRHPGRTPLRSRTPARSGEHLPIGGAIFGYPVGAAFGAADIVTIDAGRAMLTPSGRE